MKMNMNMKMNMKMNTKKNKYLNENSLKRAIIKRIKELKKQGDPLWSFCVLGNGMQEGGIPDFLLCYNGILIGAELKTYNDGYVLKSRQKVQIKKLIKAGAIAGGVSSVEELNEMIEEAKRRSSYEVKVSRY